MANRVELYNDIEEVIRTAMDGRQVSVWTAIPGIVQTVNFTNMTCSVQPSIMGAIVDQNNVATSVTLPLLVDVPIVFPSAGGFTITFPMAQGDEVLVVFSSRCIDAWWQSGGVQQPMEARMHDLSDGFAIPGPKSVPKAISSISSTGCQIRNNAGTTYVEISGNGKIKIVSPSEIDITAPLVAITGNLTVSGTITAVGNISSSSGSIAAAVNVTAGVNIVATGSLTGASIATTGGGGAVIAGSLSAASITAAGIGLSTHKHLGVTTGGGTSGGPTP